MDEIPHFKDYAWNNGIPVGLYKTPWDAPQSYRIITDPYRKRYNLEMYQMGKFKQVIYDSYLFDFRQLLKEEDASWRREVLEEGETTVRSLVRNMEERIILIEEAHFQGNVCRFCYFYSPHNNLIATQKMLLTALGDDMNGVLLVDLLEHSILLKRYEVDEQAGEFTRLLSEKSIF